MIREPTSDKGIDLSWKRQKRLEYGNLGVKAVLIIDLCDGGKAR